MANFSSGVVTLFTVTTAPAATGEIWTTGNVSNTGSYRYVRYVGPNNSYCNVRGLKFLGYPAAAPNVNLVTNPSFDAQGATQTPSGWTEWKDAATSYTETAGGAHSGANHGTHSSTIPYEVTTHQLRTGLVNGTYTLRAWVKSSGGQSPAAIFARNHGSTMLTASIPASSSWIQVTLANINVTNGQCEFGVWSRVYTGGAWLYFDDIEFVRN